MQNSLAALFVALPAFYFTFALCSVLFFPLSLLQSPLKSSKGGPPFIYCFCYSAQPEKPLEYLQVVCEDCGIITWNVCRGGSCSGQYILYYYSPIHTRGRFMMLHVLLLWATEMRWQKHCFFTFFQGKILNLLSLSYIIDMFQLKIPAFSSYQHLDPEKLDFEHERLEF